MDPQNHCPDDIWRIISDAWMTDPEQRPSAGEILQQLDDIKVSVSSAPDGQYYGSIGNYEDAGAIQGPSLDEILDSKTNMAFEEEDVVSHTDVELHKTPDDVQESGPSTIAYEKYRALEMENRRLKNKAECVKNDEDRLRHILETLDSQDGRIEEMKSIVNNIFKNNSDVNSTAEDDTEPLEIVETVGL